MVLMVWKAGIRNFVLRIFDLGVGGGGGSWSVTLKNRGLSKETKGPAG